MTTRTMMVTMMTMNISPLCDAWTFVEVSTISGVWKPFPA